LNFIKRAQSEVQPTIAVCRSYLFLIFFELFFRLPRINNQSDQIRRHPIPIPNSRGAITMSRNRLFPKKSIAITAGLALLFAAFAYPSCAQTPKEELLFKLNVEHKDGESVKISLPFSIFYTSIDIFAKDTLDAVKKEIGIDFTTFLDELSKMEGEDIVKIEGEDNVSLRIEKVTEETRKDLEFLRIQVDEGENHGNKIRICLPIGIVKAASQIAATVIKQAELDKQIQAQLPKIIEEIKKNIEIK